MTGITGVVPTQGRATLPRLLASVAAQGLRPEDEYIVVLDTLDMAPERADELEAQITAFGPAFRVLRPAIDHHCWGHCQLNVALDAARPGNYLTFNDDDDIYAEGAWDAIRRVVNGDANNGVPHCHIFQFQAAWRQVLPEGPEIREGRIGGHCLVVPNLPGRVGRLTCRYQGDYDLIADTVARWEDDIAFHYDIIAIAQPREYELWYAPVLA